MYRPGDWKAICDVCGFEYWASELKPTGRRGNNLMVCNKDWETDHPQEFVRPRTEKIKPDWVRLDDSESDITTNTSDFTVSTSPFVNVVYYNFDDAPGSLGTVTLPAANDTAFNGVEQLLLLVNTGVGPDENGTFSNFGSLSSPSSPVVNGGLMLMYPPSTTRLRAIPSQNLWIWER